MIKCERFKWEFEWDLQLHPLRPVDWMVLRVLFLCLVLGSSLVAMAIVLGTVQIQEGLVDLALMASDAYTKMDQMMEESAHKTHSPHLGPSWLLPFGLLIFMLIFAETHSGFERWWHKWPNRIMVTAPVVMLVVGKVLMSKGGLIAMEHQVVEYVQFMCYSATLYFLALGIVQQAGNLKATPLVNLGVLASSLIGSNLLGSGGYGIIVAKILLDSNQERKHTWQTYMAVIYVCCNSIAALFAQSDAPIFLSLNQGVPYFWPVKYLWGPTIFTNILILGVYFLVELIQYRREDESAKQKDLSWTTRLSFKGLWRNLMLFAVVIAALISLPTGLREACMVTCCLISAFIVSPIKRNTEDDGSSKYERHGKPFDLEPIINVGFVFALLFFTIFPWKTAISGVVLQQGFTKPDDFYMTFGVLSSFMDNAIAEILGIACLISLAEYAGNGAVSINGHLIDPKQLSALLTSTVQWGAFLTFSNWPNLVVYLMAKARGVKMPSPAAFLAISLLVLLPIFWVTNQVFYVHGGFELCAKITDSTLEFVSGLWR